MTYFKEVFGSKTWVPFTTNHDLRRTEARITNINEKSNTCDIIYVDKNNKVRPLKDVEVVVPSNPDWFPKKIGEYVMVEEFNNGRPYIIGKSEMNPKDQKKDQSAQYELVSSSSFSYGGIID